jgi:cytochrome c-type biogenesis protein CcmH/NrfG
MIKGRKDKLDTARGLDARGPIRGRGPKTRYLLPGLGLGRTAGQYGMASLVVLALCGILSLGVVGCSALFSLFGWQRAGSGDFAANVRLSPQEINRLARNAHYFKLMGQPELGLRELELAHQQNPDNLQITNILAQNYEELGKFEAARQLYQEALARHGSHPVLANNLCFSYYLEGRWQEAETCYRKALARDPQNMAARNNLGLLYCRLGRQEAARRLWREVESKAAADHKVSQALAALGRSGGAVYAQKPAPAPPAPRVTAAPKAKPKAKPVVARVPAPAPAKVAKVKALAPPGFSPGGARLARKPAPAKVEAPAPPAAPKESVGPVAQKPAAVSEKAAAVKSAVVEPELTAAANPPTPPIYLTCAELVGTAIEVRNGTWTRNLAHQTRTRLSQEGFTVAKIGNHIDFGATQTIIYYRPGVERVARALNQAFFPKAKLTQSTKLKKGMDIKILLGADLQKQPQVMASLAGEGR